MGLDCQRGEWRRVVKQGGRALVHNTWWPGSNGLFRRWWLDRRRPFRWWLLDAVDWIGIFTTYAVSCQESGRWGEECLPSSAWGIKHALPRSPVIVLAS